ncbi:hypothetical protein A3J19_02535 [Candidatus Daviesbacteria bacterium RIFCSPLOWO2_02_FULL_41_8]|uniref:Uncharacterized protein n=2 Tax=Candidatus Daviesiibacteriota TaxID=1752718 RepID=A0A1F5NGI4_9BACT|nr:MAG: hypothetical protein A3J19_02535 [Candidatus Daviesbacteria bacterium RIFCSPLOWO2_02_FULL_41_8]
MPRIKSLGFCQDLIKQVGDKIVKLLSLLHCLKNNSAIEQCSNRKVYMGIGLGAVGSAIGGIASSVRGAAGGVSRGGGFSGIGGGGISGGIEARSGIGGGPIGEVRFSGLNRMDRSPVAGTIPFVARPIINEGPASLLGGSRSLGRADLATPDMGGMFKSVHRLVNKGQVDSLAGLRPLGRRDLAAPDPGGIFRPVTELKRTQLVRDVNPAGEIRFNAKPKKNTEAPFSEAESLIKVRSVIAEARAKTELQTEKGPAEKTGEWAGGKAGRKIGEVAGRWAGGAIGRQVDQLIRSQVEPGWHKLDGRRLIRSYTSAGMKVNPFLAWVPVLTPVPDLAPVPFLSPALKPAVKTEPKPVSKITIEAKQTTNKTELATATQPVLKEQEIEETATERVTVNQIDIVEEEETEGSRLKNVVDEKVLGNRIEKYTAAVRQVASRIEADSALKNSQTGQKNTEELDGQKVIELVGPETRDERSGIVKEGPDGSREETIEDIRPRKFKSIKEAVKFIITTAYNKVPVKRAKEGKSVGDEVVARVLKRFFVKYQPREQMVTREVKKKKVLVEKGGQQPSLVEAPKLKTKEPRIVDFPALAGVFPKAA